LDIGHDFRVWATYELSFVDKSLTKDLGCLGIVYATAGRAFRKGDGLELFRAKWDHVFADCLVFD
jgi:hypothetical protein